MNFFGLLLGKNIEIINSKIQIQEGIRGLVLNESKNSIVLKNNFGVKTLIKKNLSLKIDGNNDLVKGEEILQKPYERLKLKWKRK